MRGYAKLPCRQSRTAIKAAQYSPAYPDASWVLFCIAHLLIQRWGLLGLAGAVALNTGFPCTALMQVPKRLV